MMTMGQHFACCVDNAPPTQSMLQHLARYNDPPPRPEWETPKKTAKMFPQATLSPVVTQTNSFDFRVVDDQDVPDLVDDHDGPEPMNVPFPKLNINTLVDHHKSMSRPKRVKPVAPDQAELDDMVAHIESSNNLR